MSLTVIFFFIKRKILRSKHLKVYQMVKGKRQTKKNVKEKGKVGGET